MKSRKLQTISLSYAQKAFSFEAIPQAQGNICKAGKSGLSSVGKGGGKAVG